MSPGFLSALSGVGVSLLAWFGPWTWPGWPALAILDLAIGNDFSELSYVARAATIVILIAVNVAVWAFVSYPLIRFARRR